MHGEEFMKP